MADYVDVPKGWRLVGAGTNPVWKRHRQKLTRNGQVFGVLVLTDNGVSEVLFAPWFVKSDWFTFSEGIQDCAGELYMEYDRKLALLIEGEKGVNDNG